MAAVTSYSTLKAAIADWIARGDLTDFIDQFIQNWEEDFLRDPKNFGSWMETVFDDTMASSVIAVPDDYLALKYVYINTSPSSRLDRVSLNQLYGSYPRGGCTGIPRWIARDGANFVFGPAPDSQYQVKGIYYAKPDRIRDAAGDAVDHYLIANAPDLALYGSLIAAEPFLLNDKRITLWQSMHDRQLRSYRDLQRDEDVSGSPAQEVLA